MRIKIRDEEFSLPEISAFVLREMKEIAESALGQPVSGAVITVPAYFNDNQRQATKDAGRIAGLEVLRILNEPTAAALSYGFGRDLRQTVAIYDLGGGTFDVSVLEIGEDVFEVLATCGDTYLGGDDFDDRVIDLLADEVQAEHSVNVRNDPVRLREAEARRREREDRALDRRRGPTEIPIANLIEHEAASRSRSRTRSRAASSASSSRDLILRTFKVCDEALQQSDLTVRDLDGVILVGGPTRLPMIREAVREYFQREPKTDVDPGRGRRDGRRDPRRLARRATTQAARPARRDAAHAAHRASPAGSPSRSSSATAPVPIEQTRVFTTVADYQDSVADPRLPGRVAPRPRTTRCSASSSSRASRRARARRCASTSRSRSTPTASSR